MAEQSSGGRGPGGVRKAAGWALTGAVKALVKAANFSGVTLSLTDPKGWRGIGGVSTYTGRRVDGDSAMQMSAVWACNKILAESVGMLPVGVYERQKNGNAVKVDHDLSTILVDQPNIDMTSVEFREAMQTNLGLSGNGYAFRDVNGAGQVISLYPLPSNTVSPERNKDTGEIQYKVLERGKWITYPREKVWHVKAFGNNGLIGYSPIGYMRQSIALGLNAEEFASRVFANGAYPSMVVKIPAWLKPEQRTQAQKNLENLHAGMTNAGKPFLLEGGMEFDKNASVIPPEDLQLLQSRQFSIEEIARLYRMPPHFLAVLERVTHNSIEQMAAEFVTYTLMPWLTRIESSANRWLLKPADRSRYFVRFNVDAFLRADAPARALLYATLLQNGVFSRNEVRALENKNSVEADGMDDYTVQSNMALLTMLQAMNQANASRGAPQDGQDGG